MERLGEQVPEVIGSHMKTRLEPLPKGVSLEKLSITE